VFLRWLNVPPQSRWLDVGCGTGALTARVLVATDPARVVGVDTSEGFLSSAQARITDVRSAFCVSDALSMPFADHEFDAVVSGLALNFVPDPGRAVGEFFRLAAPGGVVAAYVWDYAEGMAMMRYFWDAAIALDPSVTEREQGRRFPICRPEPLADLWMGAGLGMVTVEAIEIATVFASFDDYWKPFLGGQGAAPGYVTSLTERRRSALRDLLRSGLPTGPDGSIQLTARAWAVRGVAHV
jgi:SAM-dependent methyltransferase